MLLEHWDVTVVIEMVVASGMTGRCTWWERWLPGSGERLKVLNWNLHSFQLLEIIQVLDSISWVRCASGNVFYCFYNCYLVHLLVLVEILGKRLLHHHGFP